MDEMTFEMYGILQWLPRREFFNGPWVLEEMALGEDYGIYDIVYNTITGEYRYTEL